jgi:hypothetical protein
MVRIDQSDGDERSDAADAPIGRPAVPGPVRDAPDGTDARPVSVTAAEWNGAYPGGEERGKGSGETSAARVARSLEYRAKVAAADRAYAIDRGYARVQEIEEKMVTPAMRRIEAADPDRQLAGLENRLKGKDRLAEKIAKTVSERGRTVGEAFGLVKDAIRYTLCYPENRYTDGVRVDCARLQQAGFECVERENSWAKEQYKGINSRWRVPESGQLFEVPFHTPASFEAKEITHPAYEKLRIGVPTPTEQRELEGFQKEITAGVPIPSGAAEIPDYP